MMSMMARRFARTALRPDWTVQLADGDLFLLLALGHLERGDSLCLIEALLQEAAAAYQDETRSVLRH